MAEIDYKDSLRLTREFNKFVRNSLIRRFFSFKGLNLLQASQMSVFADIKMWTRDGDTNSFSKNFRFLSFLKLSLIFLFMMVVSVFSTLFFIARRPNVVVFTGDKLGKVNNDFRLDPLYEALRESSVAYLEIVHTIPGREMIVNFFKRRRPVIYLESFDFLSWWKVSRDKESMSGILELLPTSRLSLEEERLIRSLAIKYASATNIFRIRYFFLYLLLKLISPKKVFSIDDVRHYNELMAVSKDIGAESYGIQHGHFTKYHLGWLNFTNLSLKIIRPNKLIVWSEYWKDELVRLETYFEPEDIIVGGEKSFTERRIQRSGNKTIVNVLIPYETDAPKSEVKRYIEKILETGKFGIIFKLRMDVSRENQIVEYGLQELEDKISFTNSVKEVLPEVDIVLGTYSTFLYDMLELGRSIGILETSLDYGEGMIDSGLADRITYENLEPCLLNLHNLSLERLEERMTKLQAKDEQRLKDTLRDIIKK